MNSDVKTVELRKLQGDLERLDTVVGGLMARVHEVDCAGCEARFKYLKRYISHLAAALTWHAAAKAEDAEQLKKDVEELL